MPPDKSGAPAPHEEEPAATNTTPTVADTNRSGHSGILDTFTALYGDTTGYLHVAAGADLRLKNGIPKHAKWVEKVYEYPAQADQAAQDIAALAAAADMYLCGCLMRGPTRAKGAAVARTLPHADVDTDLDADRVHEVNGFAIASGTPGHAHVYVRVAEDLTVTEYEALCRGLGRYLGADPGKISDNDFLRPAGAFNHKPTLTGSEPAPVTWLLRPPPGEPISKHTLASRLGVTLPEPYDRTNGAELPYTAAAALVAAEAPEPVDLANYQRVLKALARDTGDRSEDIARVVGACYDAGLTRSQTRWVVASRTDLTEKQAELHHDDVARLWHKIDTERRSTAQQNYWGTGPAGGQTHSDKEDAATTWEPVDLGPWLRGEITPPQPTLGIYRSDGRKLIYPGREHAILGETESGKTWLALGCVAAELGVGNTVVYIHYEEGDPGSTIERLQLLGVDTAMIAAHLRFVAPAHPLRVVGWIEALLDPAPSLVIHDGVNEAMSLIGADIMAADGAATFKRWLVKPFLRAGAASIACDHLPKDRDGHGRSRDAYGSVHKGNALDGARIVLENTDPFGRRMRGVSHVFVTKDRPGQLRSRGRPTKQAGKTYMGTLVVDDMTGGPDFMMKLFAPKDDDGEQPVGNDYAAELADAVFDVIAALPDRTVTSMRLLFAEMRRAGRHVRDDAVRDAVADLVVAGRLTELLGTRGRRYQTASPTASQESST